MITKYLNPFELDAENINFTTCMLGLSIGGMVLVKCFTTNQKIDVFTYPNDKRENFRIITKAGFYNVTSKHL